MPARFLLGYSPCLSADQASSARCLYLPLEFHPRFQYLIRIDHSFNHEKDKLTARWISEYQQDQGGISAQKATLGKAVRGYLGPYNGLFSNMNFGHIHVFERSVNDFRFSFQNISTYVGIDHPVVPDISITGVTLGFGDIPKNGTELRTYELRDTLSMNRGKHLLRTGVELRKIFKGLSIAPPTPGSFAFSNMSSFATDAPFKQTLPWTLLPVTQPASLVTLRCMKRGCFFRTIGKSLRG